MDVILDSWRMEKVFVHIAVRQWHSDSHGAFLTSGSSCDDARRDFRQSNTGCPASVSDLPHFVAVVENLFWEEATSIDQLCYHGYEFTNHL